MAEELADGRETDAGSEPLSCEGMAEPMNRYRLRISGEGCGAHLPRGGEVALEVIADRRIVQGRARGPRVRDFLVTARNKRTLRPALISGTMRS